MGIESYSPRSGRMLKEDSTSINFANVLADVYDILGDTIKTVSACRHGIVDRALSDLTASANSGLIAEDYGISISAAINVTAVGGTLPTLDIILQESPDNGVTWVAIYHVQRFTDVGAVALPLMSMSGRRRWNYIVGGTNPTFTFSITTMRSSANAPLIRSFYDRTLNPLVAYSTGSGYRIEGCKNLTMNTVMSTAGTTACGVYPLYSSDGVNYGNPAGGAAATTSLQVNGTSWVSIFNHLGRAVKPSVNGTAGVGQTLNYVHIFATN